MRACAAHKRRRCQQCRQPSGLPDRSSIKLTEARSIKLTEARGGIFREERGGAPVDHDSCVGILLVSQWRIPLSVPPKEPNFSAEDWGSA